jgi:small subunit ribosomal protein S4
MWSACLRGAISVLDGRGAGLAGTSGSCIAHELSPLSPRVAASRYRRVSHNDGRTGGVTGLELLRLAAQDLRAVRGAEHEQHSTPEEDESQHMARYTGPVCKLCRREGRKLFLKGERCMSAKCAIERRNTRPGQHGAARVRKMSGAGLQLREKQKVRRTYGMLERQFSRFFQKAAHQPGKTGDNLFQMLEMRLDNIVYRFGFADSRAQARQLVTHGHFQVNGRKTDIPSYLCKAGEEIVVRERSRNLQYFKDRALVLNQRGVPAWLRLDVTTLSGHVLAVPTRQDLELPFDEALVVEYYQR